MMLTSVLVALCISFTLADGDFYDCDTLHGHGDHTSGVRKLRLPSGKFKAYCEMGLNGGGYTFFSDEAVQKLKQEDIDFVFKKKDVVLRLARPDGTQPYTKITPLDHKEDFSIQVNTHNGYTQPHNSHLGQYLFFGLLHKENGMNRNIQGFYSNGKKVYFRNCNNDPNSYFAFFTNPEEKPISKYHLRNRHYEHHGMAIYWRLHTALRLNSDRRMPEDYFFLTEMHFGGCGCYTSSDRWMTSRSPALGTAIGFR